MIKLTEEQQGLVKALFTYAPRWVVPLSKAMLPTMTQVAAHWLLHQTQQPGGGRGLVVGPAARMNVWWAADWQGLHVTNLKFEKMHLGTLPGDFRHVSVVLDLFPMTDKMLAELGAFLEHDATHCLALVDASDLATIEWFKAKDFKTLTLNPK